jgi:cytochrome c oxidase subunit II
MWAMLLVAAVLALTGCADSLPDFGAEKPASRQGDDILGLWKHTVVIALIVGGIAWALIVFSIFRYRRRYDGMPSQRQYIVPLELFYTITPIVLVAVIFAFSYRTQREVVDLVKDPGLVVEVTGFQWQWQFHYADEDVTVTGSPDEPPVLVLPTNTTVRLILESPDVIHSFYVPDFLSKRDVIPGIRNEIDVDVLDEGHYHGQCAEFCGLDHALMTFEVEAVSRAEFRAWITEQQRAGGEPDVGADPTREDRDREADQRGNE